MATLSFYARAVSTSANNAYINVKTTSQVPVTELVFSQTTSPISLDYLGKTPDPDTTLTINNVVTPFTISFSGALPFDNKFASVNGIDLRGQSVAVITTAGGAKFMFLTDPDTSFLTMLEFPNGAASLTGFTNSGNPLILCFASGTWIATPDGERRVETLAPGDPVLTVEGESVPLRWIAHRHLSPDELAAWPDLRPIRIPRDHFGPGLPNRALRVSPQHRIRLEGWWVELLFGAEQVLVPARHLLGGGITQPDDGRRVDYYHLLFDRHEIVLSNGLPTESYQPSARAVDGLDAAVRAEFLRLFGGTARVHFLSRPDAAPTLRAHEGRTLARSMVA